MSGRGGTGGYGLSGEEEELVLLLSDQRSRGLQMYQGGSTRPTSEGSPAAAKTKYGCGISSGVPPNALPNEEFSSSLAYNPYVNLSPHLLPPVLSKEDWRSMQRLSAGGSLSGAFNRRDMAGPEEEDCRSHLLQQSIEKGKAPVSADWLNEWDGAGMGLPLGRQASSIDKIQDGQKGGNGCVNRVPISWHAVAKAFEPPILACPAGWHSISGITDAEAAALIKDPLYIHYSNVAAYTACIVASYVDPSLITEASGPLRSVDHSVRLPANLRNINENVSGPLPLNILEEVKSNGTRSFELADITGHMVEFSYDHFGSRFIQKKLETAGIEEKDLVFREIKPYAASLMTDVFGNYVVQKLLQHGSAAQQRELTDQMKGRILELSLQMYGCRVVQKAIEVVGMAQKFQIVEELDGHVMLCVHDQNGNHVIQNCIEHIPHEKIHFIISTFYNQVTKLSTHPYGCRVIQRVLEHSDDPNARAIVMDEIMQSVCLLALDQYGNYVVQQMLENGKPDEISLIIKKLSGQIVQMSLHKSASNVIEKCFSFGRPEDRQLLLNEILSSTDQNEGLQAMIKDQYGNFVVQKALELCNNQQREQIVSRINAHLKTMNKYAFGKHIVAGVEKLIRDGEKRMCAGAINAARPIQLEKLVHSAVHGAVAVKHSSNIRGRTIS